MFPVPVLIPSQEYDFMLAIFTSVLGSIMSHGDHICHWSKSEIIPYTLFIGAFMCFDFMIFSSGIRIVILVCRIKIANRNRKIIS